MTKGFRFSLVDATIEARRQWVKFIPFFLFFCLSFTFKSGSTLSAQHFSVFNFNQTVFSRPFLPILQTLDAIFTRLDWLPLGSQRWVQLTWSLFQPPRVVSFSSLSSLLHDPLHHHRHRYIVAVIVIIIIYFHFSQSPLLVCEYFFHLRLWIIYSSIHFLILQRGNRPSTQRRDSRGVSMIY